MDKQAEIDMLRQQVQVLSQYLNDDLLVRIAAEHGWPHEPNNSRGIWCCDDHEQRYRDGTLYPSPDDIADRTVGCPSCRGYGYHGHTSPLGDRCSTCDGVGLVTPAAAEAYEQNQ